MTPEEAGFKGIIAGGILTLAGTFLTSIIGMIVQWLQTRWMFQIEKRKDLYQKRLVALQNCVQLADFLIASKNANLGPKGFDIWTRIRTENVCNGAFFPKELQDDFEKVIQSCLLLDDLSKSEEILDYTRLNKLRSGCVEYIQREF